MRSTSSSRSPCRSARPEAGRPAPHLIEALKKDRPRRVIIKPPAADTRSQCELDIVEDRAGARAGPTWPGILPTLLCLRAESQGSGRQLDDRRDPGRPDARPAKEKLNSEECLSNGYVLEGYPNTAMQARAMLAAGLLPSRVLVLQLDDEEVKRRLDGRRVDNANNKVYHLTDAPPPAGADVVHREDDKPEQVELRLAAYRQAAAAVLPHFRKVLRELDGRSTRRCSTASLTRSSRPRCPRARRAAARAWCCRRARRALRGGGRHPGCNPGCTPAPASPLALATPLQRPCCAPAAPHAPLAAPHTPAAHASLAAPSQPRP